MKHKFFSGKSFIVGGLIVVTALLSACGGGKEYANNLAPVSINTAYRAASFIKPRIYTYTTNQQSLVTSEPVAKISGFVDGYDGNEMQLFYLLGIKKINIPVSKNQFSFHVDLKNGDNRIIISIQNNKGELIEIKDSNEMISKGIDYYIVRHPSAQVIKDFELSDSRLALGYSKKIIANIQLEKKDSVESIEIVSFPSDEKVSLMQDYGILPDEIKSDGLFTGEFDFSAKEVSNSCYRAIIKYKDGNILKSGINCIATVKPYTENEQNIKTNFEMMLSSMHKKSEKNNRIEKSKDVVLQIKKIKKFKSIVKEISYDEEGRIYFELTNGVSGVFIPYVEGTASVSNGNEYMKYANHYLIAPYGGISGRYGVISGKHNHNKIPAEIVGSYTFDTLPYDTSGTIDSFKNMTSTGILNIYTHSRNYNGVTRIGTGESAKIKNCSPEVSNFFSEFLLGRKCYDYSKYEEDVDSGLIHIREDLTYEITPDFLRKYNKSLDLKNSLVVMSSCESGVSSDLAKFFFEKGAAAYIGYTKIIFISHALDFAQEFYKNLMKNKSVKMSRDMTHKTVGKGFFGAEPKLFFRDGVNDLFIPDLSLKNGNFETGFFSGWKKEGDGRLMAAIGDIKPIDGRFMGLLSTGLGYTKSSGSLSQNIFVKNSESNLNFSWNFMSEEFKGYCGTQYQDSFSVSACKHGSCTVLFKKKIDDLCESVVKTNQVFNQGDVWGTGWKSASVSLILYRNQKITLKFEANDVGDSAYDTVVLLDAISVN